MLRRTPLRRRTRLKPSRGTTWPPTVVAHARSHQHGCIGQMAGMPGDCSRDEHEGDHVRVGGTGLKSPSIAINYARLCHFHHRMKTEAGKTWRPALLAVIALLHGECAACQRQHIEWYGTPLSEVAA